MNSQPLHGGSAAYDRDRDMEEQRHRALQQQEEAAQREREQKALQARDAYPPSAPHHSSAGSLPIHQPVASRVSGAIHSPGGLLANHGGSAPGSILGAPPGPAAAFGGPLHSEPGRPPPQGAQASGPGPQHQMFGPIPHSSAQPNSAVNMSNGPPSIFGPPLQPDSGRGGQGPPYGQGMAPGNHQAPGGSGGSGGPGVAQNQQPILNDALSYLDQVKVQFHEQPDVYNRFLDIMKDFKSQTIDTPGVINRVSELFAGHPNLIQGFNTFLPPGYRIECGLENNPNSIRVTTPSGSTIHSIGGAARNAPPENSQSSLSINNGPFSNPRQSGWQPVQQTVDSPDAAFSVPATNGAGPYHGAGQAAQFENQGSIAQQRGQPAQTGMGSHQQPPRDAHTPTPGGGAVNGNSSQASMEKRGPVEFNHAISYVNKIKNRFQDKPEIYKQFLEILQTYQREQKPIQDVYSQVTTLFHTAPDLLEDFKQFLPESAAQTRPFGPRAGEEGNPRAATSTPQPGHSIRDGPKMPPVGNFAPPASAGKESKKRPRNEKQPPLPPASTNDAQASAARVLTGGAASNKRTKVAHKSAAAEAAFVEPTLTPYIPEPIAPALISPVTQDQLAFFDRARKHLNNRLSMSEFLKLLNLYSNDLIDQDILVHKASQFIGANLELLKFFKDTVNAKGQDEIIENLPEPPTGRVSLSNCRGYGPSYRLLPKRERLKPCSGRDELCNEVLNDEWASHPTWASEDSGFVAHRKNGYEEGLHRIEEERHDYDFYIEANQKCIQLLEPIAQQMLALPPADRTAFKLPTGLGGQSTSIYKRVLKKIYGTDRGAEVVSEMFSSPFAVVPIVMARLRQKDEEWRFTQREWEKVWQSQTESMHLKSLDHMGIQVKSADKRNLSAKHLVDMIKTKHEEQRRARESRGREARVPRYQFLFSFDDEEVLLDLLRFMVVFVTNGGQHNAVERRRILEFFETFVPQFFDLPEDKVQEKLADIDQESAAEEDEDEPAPTELTNGRARRNGKKSDLLRGVLDPGRNGAKSRTQKEDSAAASASKETTPDLGSANEEEMPDAADDNTVPDVSNERWLPTIPRPTVPNGVDSTLLGADGELRADAPFRRTTYNFYCNQNIYVFLSIFRALYQRLKDVKESGSSVTEELRRERADKPAKTLGLVQGGLNYFDNVAPDAYWARTVNLIEEFINGATDENRYQEVLRHYYLKNGWTLYTIQDLLKSLCRLGLACNNPDTKGEKTKELVREYLASRQQEDTSYQTEISARKYAEKCIKDGEMFVIGWKPEQKETTIRWIQKDETTFYMDEMEVRERWQYYISSWVRVEPTEGVPRSKLSKVVLERNLPSGADSAADDVYATKAIAYDEGMVIGVCLHTSAMTFEKGTTEYFIFNRRRRPNPKNGPSPPAAAAADGNDAAAAAAAATAAAAAAADVEAARAAKREEARLALREARDQKFREKLVMNNAWMRNMSREEVQRTNEAFQAWIRGDGDGAAAAAAAAPAAAAPVAAAAEAAADSKMVE